LFYVKVIFTDFKGIADAINIVNYIVLITKYPVLFSLSGSNFKC